MILGGGPVGTLDLGTRLSPVGQVGPRYVTVDADGQVRAHPELKLKF